MPLVRHPRTTQPRGVSPRHERYLPRLPAAGRLLGAFAASLLGVLCVLLVGAVPARAAAPPTSVTVEGPGLGRPLAVLATAQHDIFTALLRQVSWMAGAPGDPIHPDPGALGPRYILTVYAKDAPVGIYELYPQAPGGPRAHRPAKQPGGTVGEAWFYASVAMPDVLRSAGVPLTRPTASGSADTLVYDDPVGNAPALAASQAPAVSLGTAFSGQARTLLAWAGTAFVLLLVMLVAARRSHLVVHRRTPGMVGFGPPRRTPGVVGVGSPRRASGVVRSGSPRVPVQPSFSGTALFSGTASPVSALRVPAVASASTPAAVPPGTVTSSTVTSSTVTSSTVASGTVVSGTVTSGTVASGTVPPAQRWPAGYERQITSVSQHP